MSDQLQLLPVDDAPEGFSYIRDFLTHEVESELLQRMDSLQWKEVRMHGVVAKRRVIHFGVDYTYDSRDIKPTAPPAPFLLPLLEKASRLLGIPQAQLAEVLISKYPPGAGIGWHRDAPAFGEPVFGVSLGAPCMMKLRIKLEDRWKTFKVELEPRSAYVLAGPARWEWSHSIPPVTQTRYSITLRSLRK